MHSAQAVPLSQKGRRANEVATEQVTPHPKVEVVQAYASRTGTRKNLDALRAAGWRLMISPEGVQRDEGFRYCLDNGAWTAFQQKRPWDDRKFISTLCRFGSRADFVVAPDVVMGGLDSLVLSRSWLGCCMSECRIVLIAVQNGMTPDDVRPWLGQRVGVFVGGDTPWKERTMGTWAALARECGTVCHVGRVNSQRRARLCQHAGVDSFDGSGPSRMVKHLEQMQRALVQGAFLFPGNSGEST